MKTKIIEVTNGPRNWGKMMVCRFDGEWSHDSRIYPSAKLLGGVCGWTSQHLLLVDLQTGEGAIFKHGGMPAHDLQKHKIWVCPMYEPFLGWLYKQDISDLEKLPDTVDLPEAEFQMSGYRRPGPETPETVREELMKILGAVASQYATVEMNKTVPEPVRQDAIARSEIGLAVAKSMCVAAGVAQDAVDTVVAFVREDAKRYMQSSAGDVQQG